MSEREKNGPKDRSFLLATFVFAAIILGAIGLFMMPTADPLHGKYVTALATATSLDQAVNAIYTEYGRIPDVGSSVATNSSEGMILLNILLGFDDKSDKALNSRAIKFLSIKEGKNKKNGLIYANDGGSVEGLFDPWGNPYTVFLAGTDADELHFTIAGKSIDLKGRRVATVSPEVDGRLGTSDDVRNW